MKPWRRAAGALALSAAALGLLSSCGGAAAASPSPSTSPRPIVVQLTIHHSHFTPDHVDVPAGSDVRFVITNTDPIDHEFIVGPPEVHARHEVGRESHHHGDVPGEVSVAADSDASTTYRFEAPGDVVYACHLPGHFAYGMKGIVTVVPR